MGQCQLYEDSYHVGHHHNLFDRGINQPLLKTMAEVEKVFKNRLFTTLSDQMSKSADLSWANHRPKHTSTTRPMTWTGEGSRDITS
jgi:hypothetical protein